MRTQVVLVVDDEVDIRESLKDLFEASLGDTKVLTADSGATALEILHREPVDLIVTDYKMPGMNGLEFLAEARKAVRGVPRVLITAFPDLELAIRAVNEENIENFFTKPLEPQAVVEVVRSILSSRRADELRNRAFARSLDMLRRQVRAQK
ncbi:MAG: response regulator [Thermoplasmatota archaeon]